MEENKKNKKIRSSNFKALVIGACIGLGIVGFIAYATAPTGGQPLATTSIEYYDYYYDDYDEYDDSSSFSDSYPNYDFGDNDNYGI